jgi:hypothetical protein
VISGHRPVLTGFVIALLAASQAAQGISMRHDTAWSATDSTNPYVAEGALYDAVGYIHFNIGGFGYTSSGTLVESAVPGQFKFLTAAHVVDDEGPGGSSGPDGVIDANSFIIYFGDNTGPNGGTATGTAFVDSFDVAVHSFYTNGDGSLAKGADQYDLAVMTFDFFTGTLPTPMGLSFANPVGQIGTMVGYGLWGNGLTFAGNPDDGIRRAGKNVIDSVGVPADHRPNSQFTIQTDFDGPSGQGNSLGSNTALALEATTALGDSGGPLIVGGKLVGVLDGGFAATGGGDSEYGDRSIWASFLLPANQSFLAGAGVLVPVPEPATAALLGIASLALLVRRRRWRLV